MPNLSSQVAAEVIIVTTLYMSKIKYILAISFYAIYVFSTYPVRILWLREYLYLIFISSSDQKLFTV